MAWLRLILLLAGALFIGLLIWWERRRPRQAQGGSMRAERNEPSFDLGTAPGPSAAVEPQAGVAAAGAGRPAPAGGGLTGAAAAIEAPLRDRETRLPPPVIDWSDAEVSGGDGPAMTHATAPDPVMDSTLLPDLPPLIVDWPPEADRRIVSLRILPARQDRLAGRALRQGLAGCGFRHGPFGIFHLPETDGRVVLSAASLVRPGVLDPENMDFQRFAGINLFAVLPGPLRADLTLDRLAAVAAELADRIAGRVQDESGAAFNGARLTDWRQRCLASLSPEPPASAGAGSDAAGRPAAAGGSTQAVSGQAASGQAVAGQAD